MLSPLQGLCKRQQSKSKKYAFVDDLKMQKKIVFTKLLKKYKDFNIDQKLIFPCLEYHCNILLKLSNSKFIHDEEKFINRYRDEVLPGLREEIEEFENYQFDETNPQPKSVSEAIKITNAKILINSISEFYFHLEILRKKYMPNFIAPKETFLLPVLNSIRKYYFQKIL